MAARALPRREFVALLAATMSAWTGVARAQQGGPRRRIGVLMNLAEEDPEGQARIGAFRRALEKLGWVENRNLLMDYRWGAANAERHRRYAVELVALAPDGIFFTFGLRVPAGIPITMRLGEDLTAVLSARVSGYQFELVCDARTRERGRPHAPAPSTRNLARNQATRLPFFWAPAESLCTALPACTLICFASSVSFSSVSFSSSSVSSSKDACSECPRVSANALTVP